MVKKLIIKRLKKPPVPVRLRRYTSLGSLIHILQTKQITLLNPATWDDKNDAYFMSEFKRLKNAKTLLALCFAESDETYHHWRVFSNGPDGVCIEFEKDALLDNLRAQPNVSARLVDYELIANLRKKDIKIDQLPFLKRRPYIDECEHRIIYVDTVDSLEFKNLDIELGWIKRVTLSPWMSLALRASVAKTLHSISSDCRKLSIVRSTLIGNSEWQSLTSRAI